LCRETSTLPRTDANQLTVGMELNKLASYVGVGRARRNSWEQDSQQAMLPGEKVAINVLRDQAHPENENYTTSPAWAFHLSQTLVDTKAGRWNRMEPSKSHSR
jgi:hypothetical protein